ncbi:ankyrin repeat protein [Deerpox virus W-1170-84]|uniref:Ankyrin repeat protein n=1 Tax=Deerpox virus (strain W-1170-84) TaxID=305676 RepID=Q08FG6_DPV84|nr:ankyrin repeat protein [Deerpox virus W-1170-84]
MDIMSEECNFMDQVDYMFSKYSNPLFYYIESGDEEGVKKWIKLSNENNDFNEPPILSCLDQEYVNKNILKLLIENGANVNCIIPGENISLLSYYLTYNKNVSEEILKILIDANANINEINSDGKNLLHVYLDNISVNVEIMKFLIEMGNSPFNKDKHCNNILYTYLMYHDDQKIVDFLVSIGLDYEECNNMGLNCIDISKNRGIVFNKD